MIPRGTFLGELTIETVYDAIDGPRLFLARSKSGLAYLAYWADEHSDRDIWFYTPISYDRIAGLEDGEVSIHDAIRQPEDGFVFRVETPFEKSKPPVIANILADSISDDLLPESNDFLELDRPIQSSIGTSGAARK